MKKVLLSTFAAIALCVVIGCGKGEISAPAEETPTPDAEQTKASSDTSHYPPNMSPEMKKKMEQGTGQAIKK